MIEKVSLSGHNFFLSSKSGFAWISYDKHIFEVFLFIKKNTGTLLPSNLKYILMQKHFTVTLVRRFSIKDKSHIFILPLGYNNSCFNTKRISTFCRYSFYFFFLKMFVIPLPIAPVTLSIAPFTPDFSALLTSSTLFMPNVLSIM